MTSLYTSTAFVLFFVTPGSTVLRKPYAVMHIYIHTFYFLWLQVNFLCFLEILCYFCICSGTSIACNCCVRMPEGNIWQLTGQRRFSIFGSNKCWEETGKSVLCFSQVVIWRADTGTEFWSPSFHVTCHAILIDWSLNTKLAKPFHFVLLCCHFWNTLKRMSECYNTDGNDTEAACANHKKSNNFVFARFRIMLLF